MRCHIIADAMDAWDDLDEEYMRGRAMLWLHTYDRGMEVMHAERQQRSAIAAEETAGAALIDAECEEALMQQMTEFLMQVCAVCREPSNRHRMMLLQ